MTEWVDFTVYATLIAALFFVQPRAGRRLTVPVLADRNPQWVADNPETVRKIARGQWFLWVLHAVGAGGIALLAGVQLGLLDLAPGPLPDGSPVEKWMTLWDINVGFILLAILLGGGAGLYFWFGVYRRIPLASRRQAALDRRFRAALVSLRRLCPDRRQPRGMDGGRHRRSLFWTGFLGPLRHARRA